MTPRRLGIHAHQRSITTPITMARYHPGDDGRMWNYDQDYLAPEPPTRPLNRRRRQKDGGFNERPEIQRNFHSDTEGFSRPIVEHVGAPRVPSPPRPRFGGERPRMPPRDYHSDNDIYPKRVPSPPRFPFADDGLPAHQYHYPDEAFGHPPANGFGIVMDPHNASTTYRQQSRQQVPSPPRVTIIQNGRRWEQLALPNGELSTQEFDVSRPHAPSPPRPGFLGERLALEERPRSVFKEHYEDSDSDSEDLKPLRSKSKTRDPVPPVTTKRRKPKVRAHADGADDKIRPGDDFPEKARSSSSMQYRASPPLPPTLLPTILEVHPSGKKSANKGRSRRMTVSSDPKQHGRSPSPPEDVDPRCVRYRVPSPPPVNRRRHSDMDVS